MQKPQNRVIMMPMNTLIHADIFFFITTIWVIIISAIVAFILWKVAGVMSDIREISKKVRAGSEVLSEDLSELRKTFKTEGAGVKHVWKYFQNLFDKRKGHKK